jgi:hypothetical protein
VAFSTTNHDFFGGQTLARDPLYAVQGHAIWRSRRGVWVALDGTYYTGGTAAIDGVRGSEPEHLRVGSTIAIPVDRHHSLRLYGSMGAVSRVGGDFETVGLAWQYRWGGGLR